VASAIAASMVATAAGAEKPSSGAAMSKRSTRRLRPSSAKNATAPITPAATLFAHRPNSFGARSSGVAIASSSRVRQAAIDMRAGISPTLYGASHWNAMPSGRPSRLSSTVKRAIAPAAAAAAQALRGRASRAAKKLAASSTNASAAEGGIGAKSAPRSRSTGTSIAQPHSAMAPSSATRP
jgi:hypothetical protein